MTILIVEVSHKNFPKVKISDFYWMMKWSRQWFENMPKDTSNLSFERQEPYYFAKKLWSFFFLSYRHSLLLLCTILATNSELKVESWFWNFFYFWLFSSFCCFLWFILRCFHRFFFWCFYRFFLGISDDKWIVPYKFEVSSCWICLYNFSSFLLVRSIFGTYCQNLGASSYGPNRLAWPQWWSFEVNG